MTPGLKLWASFIYLPKDKSHIQCVKCSRCYWFNFTNYKIPFQTRSLFKKKRKKEKGKKEKHGIINNHRTLLNILFASQLNILIIYYTLQVAEQNGAKSSVSGKSTCLFTLRRLNPAWWNLLRWRIRIAGTAEISNCFLALV